jgi:PfaD family protein
MHATQGGSCWRSTAGPPAFGAADLLRATQTVREAAHIVHEGGEGRLGLALGGEVLARAPAADPNCFPLIASLPPLYPEWLGDRSFGEVHGLRFPYVGGAMANGIATAHLVSEMAKAGFLAFFGAAGLSLDRVERALHELQAQLHDLPWGSNLIHSPNEPELEEAVADLYIRQNVRRVSASAYMALTPAIVRYACTGLRRGPSGGIERRHHVFAKISRPEVARLFLEPPPQPILRSLVERGSLSAQEAELASQLPLAEDITVEADSGGHTDNRPLTALFPTIVALRDQVAAARGYPRPIRIGAAGGLGTPQGIAAAFSMGAAYVLTGSVNQACVESGLSQAGREMLAQATVADCIMAPAADMFEQGVEVQVLQRGSMFAVRARKLHELYRSHSSLESISDTERARVEKQLLRATFEEAWQSTESFWMDRDPGQVERARRDPKHKMALVFRSYLGLASRWANRGELERRADFQIWCGPAMGAFNAWVAGSFLEAPERRTVVQVARNLMEGAAVVQRAQMLRSFGLAIPAAAFDFRPRPLA